MLPIEHKEQHEREMVSFQIKGRETQCREK